MFERILKSFWELFQALILLYNNRILAISVSLVRRLIKIPKGRHENKNQLLKREGKRLLMGLLTNKGFSKLTLSGNFKIKLFLNRRLTGELHMSEG